MKKLWVKKKKKLSKKGLKWSFCFGNLYKGTVRYSNSHTLSLRGQGHFTDHQLKEKKKIKNRSDTAAQSIRYSHKERQGLRGQQSTCMVSSHAVQAAQSNQLSRAVWVCPCTYTSSCLQTLVVIFS